MTSSHPFSELTPGQQVKIKSLIKEKVKNQPNFNEPILDYTYCMLANKKSKQEFSNNMSSFFNSPDDCHHFTDWVWEAMDNLINNNDTSDFFKEENVEEKESKEEKIFSIINKEDRENRKKRFGNTSTSTNDHEDIDDDTYRDKKKRL